MHTCKSGRHTWTDAGDAAKCCNGYKRQLVVAQLTLGETLPADARHVQHEAGAAYAYVWAPAGDSPTQEKN